MYLFHYEWMFQQVPGHKITLHLFFEAVYDHWILCLWSMIWGIAILIKCLRLLQGKKNKDI